jgi:HAD superfamily hydrolase (TIGR01509 family)
VGGTVTLQAVVFDFDGLVMDSEWAIYEAASLAFATHGHELEVAAWATIVGINDDNDASWWGRLCEAAGVDGFERADFDAIYEDGDARDALRAAMLELPALPGVEVLVDSLTSAGVPLGVASSSSTGWLERNLERLGLLHRFGTLVGADAVGGVGKPAPDVYLRACADLGADPARSVALEDSAHGVTAAKAAGMHAVAVPSRITRFNDFGHADLLVESLEHLTIGDLAALVERTPR